MSRAHILRSGPLTPPLTGTQLNAYLEYMPPAEVEKSRNFITYESELNEREYKRAIGKDTINAPPDAPPPAGATAAVV